MTGFFIMLIFCVLLVTFILRAGFTIRRTAVLLTGALVSTAVLAIPGTIIALGGAVVGATGVGGGSVMWVGIVLCIAGLFPGGFVGIAIVERRQRKVRFSRKGFAFYLVGLGISAAVGFGCLLLAQNDPIFEVPFLILTVPGTVLGGVSGYAVFRNQLDAQS
ncbi:MAG: hypothetical protein JXX14_17470 [Deltaproteobacteria bacterium]|nr:hypothetical protein [Deltaproteobacteria bacterium]